MRKMMCFVLLLFLFSCETIAGPEGEEPLYIPGAAVPPPIVEATVEGRADPATMRTLGGYFIGGTGDMWHVVAAGKDRPRIGFPRDIFTGAIRVENGFIVSAEKRIPRPPDDLRVRRDEILFTYEVEREIKGFDFAVQTVGLDYCVVFDLQINGIADPGLVRLGRGLSPVAALPLRICVRR